METQHIANLSLALAAGIVAAPALADCGDLPSHAQLKTALDAAVAAESSGLNNNMWATLVDRDGVVCAVAFSGANRGSEWPGSRVISAQKANTANAFSLDSSSASGGSGQPNGLALSTANLYSAVQPGGSLYGLQHSNPVDTGVAYGGNSKNSGQHNDPMVGRKIGGVNVFGGALAAYASGARLVGAGGLFDPEAMIMRLKQETEQALAKGYPALRVTGEMTWATRGYLGSERLTEYEARLNEFIPGSRCLAICQYDRRQFDPILLMDVLATHPKVIIGAEVMDNLYYLPPGEFFSPQAKAAKLAHFVDNLAERRRSEATLARQTCELHRASQGAELPAEHC